jgi:two-component system, chemotaxis family, sensor kinase Cph1
MIRDPGDEASPSLEHLLHELRVHQTELEMQNDELRRTQLALEESRDRYVDLYEFAPVGYLILSKADEIAKINLTGATMLGVDRAKVISRRFTTFVAASDHDCWHRHLVHALHHSGRHECELTLLRGTEANSPAISIACCRKIPPARCYVWH